MENNNKSKALKLLAAILALLLLLIAAAVIAYMSWEEAPETVEPAPLVAVETEAVELTPEPMAEGTAVMTEREDGVYTILLVGNDQGNGNTDTIMVAKLDTLLHRINVVSIPRDTLINNAWIVRKLNSVYWGAESGNGEGIEYLRKNIKRLMGFDVDCYAVVDLDVLAEAVNTIGGIYYDVPMAMDYEDIGQELYIHLEPGYQLLNGEQVMHLCRYRSGFIDGDLGRINQQHDFLKAAAEQFISVGNIPNAPKLAKLLADDLTTDLSASNIAFFMRQLMLCKTDDIRFFTAPNDAEMINGYSYAVLRLYDWLDMVNNYLSPFSTPIQAGDVDIVFRSGDTYIGTRGLVDEDYYITPTEENSQIIFEETEEPAEPEPTERPNFSAPEE